MEKSSRFERFILDSSLGRLTRYLRMMGYDALYMENASARIVLKGVLRTNRFLLTRTRELASRHDLNVYLVRSDKVLDQVAEVAGELDLKLTSNAMGRCLSCNAPLETIEKEGILDELPPHVRKTQNSFSKCPVCLTVFWPGTHYARSLDRLLKAIRGN